MASQVLSLETPPESGECCLFKLPPELRVVIYQMAFEGLCFDGEEGLDEMTRDRMTKMQGEPTNGDAGVRGLARITENGDGAEEDEEDEADGTADEEEHEYTNGEDEIKDVEDDTQDKGDAVNIEDDEIGDEEVDSSNGEDETRDEQGEFEQDNHNQEEGHEIEEGEHDEVSSNSDADGDEDDDLDLDLDESEANSAGTEDDARENFHITRPPLLATCQQIRREAIPVYSNALAVLTTKILTDANDTISTSKKLIEGYGNELGSIRGFFVSMLKVKLLNMGYASKDRVLSIVEEIVSIEASVGESIQRSKQTKDRLVEATAEFRKLIFDVTAVDLGEESA